MPQSANEAELTIRLLGPIDIRVAGQPLPRLRSRAGLWLLSLLVLRHPRPVERDWLAGTLWPESAQGQALSNLRHRLTELRRALGAEGRRLLTPTAHTLSLDLAGADVDLIEFDAALQGGEVEALERAVSLYRGDLLEGCSEEWILLDRQAREEGYFTALQKLAEYASVAVKPGLAAQYLRRAVGANPLCESVQRALMQALSDDGDYAAASLVYSDLRQRLYREFNAQPDPETTLLFRRLREQAHVRGKQSPHRASEEITPVPPRCLPQPLTPLLGRQTEIQEIIACMATSRLVTLTGIGGVGKTRLAIAVAESLAPEYPDGVWFVDLSGLSDPSLVPQSVAVTLGLREEAGRTVLQTLWDWLGSRRLLLVPDNCEHLIEACARLVGALLQSCPVVQVLATSRQDLGLTGEVAWRVPGLPTPDPHLLSVEEKGRVSLLMEYEAVHLFVDRALRAAPPFHLTPQNAEAVAQVCHRLDGIPLAIELAAARVRSLSVEEIAARLDDRFRLLTGGSRTALPRQQTLRALLDWSYDLLTEQEKTLLSRLSVFAGGWTLEAAETVCSDNDTPSDSPSTQNPKDMLSLSNGSKILNRVSSLAVSPLRGIVPLPSSLILDLLSALVDKSLVVAQTRECETSYSLLETVRQYAAERLRETAEADTPHVQHRNYFLALAEEAERQLSGEDQAAWLVRLEAEHDNLRSALEYCRTVADGAEAGVRLAGALARFWLTRGHLSEGRSYLAEALGREEVVGPTQMRTKGLLGAGALAWAQGDYEAAKTFYQECLAISRVLEDQRGIASVLNNLGTLAFHQGDYTAARALYEESLAIRRMLEDRRGIASVLNNLGALAFHQGDYIEVRMLYEESRTILWELGDKRGVSTSLFGLGSVVQAQGDYIAAQALYEESLTILRELGDRRGISFSLFGLGDAAMDQGDYTAAGAIYEESLTIQRELGDKQGISLSLFSLGNVAIAQGDYTAAQALYEESLMISRELGDKRGISLSLFGLGDVALDRRDYTAAQALYEESLMIQREMGQKKGMICSMESFARLAAEEGQAERAARLWGAAKALRKALGSPLPPNERKRYEQLEASLCAALGEKAFSAVRSQGCAMTLEQAVAFALSWYG